MAGALLSAGIFPAGIDLGRQQTGALGAGAEILVTDGELTGAAAGLLEVALGSIAALASRFREDSELSRLNACSGTRFCASADLVDDGRARCGQSFAGMASWSEPRGTGTRTHLPS